MLSFGPPSWWCTRCPRRTAERRCPAPRRAAPTMAPRAEAATPRQCSRVEPRPGKPPARAAAIPNNPEANKTAATPRRGSPIILCASGIIRRKSTSSVSSVGSGNARTGAMRTPPGCAPGESVTDCTRRDRKLTSLRRIRVKASSASARAFWSVLIGHRAAGARTSTSVQEISIPASSTWCQSTRDCTGPLRAKNHHLTSPALSRRMAGENRTGMVKII